MRAVGVHLRIMTTMIDVIQEAHALRIDTFQSFLIHQISGTYLAMSADLMRECARLQKEYFTTTFAHASYWINLGAGDSEKTLRALKKELSLAKKLGFTYLVMHPGSFFDWQTRQEGMACVARVINNVMHHEHDIRIVLENTAYGSKAIGSDFADLLTIKKMLDHPDRVLFCIDTAHAYAYGYIFNDQASKESFIQLIDTTIGLGSLALIHLNDTKEEHGCKRDRHDLLGQGNIGITALRDLVNDWRLSKVPLIMELPVISSPEQEKLIAMVKQWHKGEDNAHSN